MLRVCASRSLDIVQGSFSSALFLRTPFHSLAKFHPWRCTPLPNLLVLLSNCPSVPSISPRRLTSEQAEIMVSDGTMIATPSPKTTPTSSATPSLTMLDPTGGLATVSLLPLASERGSDTDLEL